jgi:predicted RNase H-like HicB family nuclease
MKPADLVLRCYAEQDDGSWFAICLDLNLYARGDSYEEVRDKLFKLIAGYVKEALADVDYFDDLVPRRAPLSFWLRYACLWCESKIHQARSAIRFTLLMPLVPAV